jgi:hypothetical protein
MERIKQICEAGQKYLNSMDDFQSYHTYPREAFIDGAKWADAHPNTDDIETVLAYTYKGLGWLAENVEFDTDTMGDRALACTETLQLICNQAIMELRNPKPKKIKL